MILHGSLSWFVTGDLGSFTNQMMHAEHITMFVSFGLSAVVDLLYYHKINCLPSGMCSVCVRTSYTCRCIGLPTYFTEDWPIFKRIEDLKSVLLIKYLIRRLKIAHQILKLKFCIFVPGVRCILEEKWWAHTLHYAVFCHYLHPTSYSMPTPAAQTHTENLSLQANPTSS